MTLRSERVTSVIPRHTKVPVITRNARDARGNERRKSTIIEEAINREENVEWKM